ncbi:hypothetical protein [Selenomonas sp. AB3002]|uniref:beta strand repeat-containing protein n=1 Tax=Selenomonas sp. AB3002 TaxID=1392502 RepID=UPI0016396BE5
MDTSVFKYGTNRFTTEAYCSSEENFVIGTDGSVTAPGAVTVVSGNITLATNQNASFATDADDTASVTYAENLDLSTSPTVTFKNGSVKITEAEAANTTATKVTKAGVVSGLDVGGTAEFADLANTTYKAAVNGTVIDYNNGNAKLIAGAIILATGESFEMAGKGIVTNNGTAAIAVDKDGNITWTATDDVSFTTKDSSEDTAKLHTYKVKNGNLFVYNADSTDFKIYSAGASVTMATNEQDYYGEVVNGTTATGGDIHVAPTATTTAGAHYFNADGIELPDDNGFAIWIWYTKVGANTLATIPVGRPLTVKVNLTGAETIDNRDENKYATYTIKGSDFKGSGVNTLVDGEKTIILGEVTALTGKGTYDLADSPSNSITFAGKGKTDATLPTGATINLVMGDGKYVPVVVTEASADADVNDTVIRGDGIVRGLDTGATVAANKITATAGADNLSLSVMNNGLVTEDEKIAFTTESGGSFTFTSATSATNLKGVTATMSEGTSVVGARGETESVTALSETGGEVKADANGDLTITKAGQYTALENGEIAVAAEGKVEFRTGDNAVLFAGDSGNKVTGTYKGSGTAAKVEATLTSTNAAASLTATKAGAKLTVHGTEYIATADNTTVCYGTNTAELTAGAVTLAKDNGIEVAGKGLVTNNGTADITVDKDGNITWTATDDVSFTTKDNSEDTANLHTYKVKNGNLFVYNADSTDFKIYSAGASVTMATNEQDYYGEVVNGTLATGGDIHVAPTATTTAGIHYFNADGIELPDDNGFAIQIWYAEDGANTPATIHVERPLTVKVNLTGATTLGNKDDENKYATYTINGSDFKSSSFSTFVEGEKTLISGEVTALTGNGTYDLEDSPSNSITFAGKGKTDATLPEGATINLQNGNGKYVPVVVTEASADADINDTVIIGNGIVRGLDTGATVTANKITATAGADNLFLFVMNNKLVTEDVKIAFTTESGGSFTFTSATSATNLKGVTATMTAGTTVVGARGESESVTALSETGGEVKADANGDLTITKAGQYTALENGEIAVAAEGKVEFRTGDNAVLFAGDSGNEVTGTYKGSNTAANVEATLTSTNAAASLTATKAGAKLTVHGTEYIATADNTTVCYGTNTAELTAGTVLLDQGEVIAAGSASYKAAAGGATIDATSGFVGGAVTLDTGETVTVGGTTYTATANGTVIDYNNGTAKLTAGAITLAKDNGIEVAGKGLVTNNGTADIAVDKDGNITWTATDGVSFTTKDSSEDTANLHTYKVKNGNLFVYNADSTDLKIYSAWDSVTMATNEQDYYGEVVNGTPATGGDIHVAPTATTKAGEHYFNADGIELPDDNGFAIQIWYAEDGANTSATIHVERPLTVKVNLTGVKTISNADQNKYATYTIKGSDFKCSGFHTFVEGAKTLISGEVTALTGNGTYDLADGPINSITFAGKGKTDATLPEGATINLQNGNGKYVPVVVTEASADADINDTVIIGNGIVRGLDTGAAVTANNITATAGADNLFLSIMNNGLVTEDVKIAFTTESGGSFTFTSATSATNLKGVTATMSEGTSVVGARGETESVTALSETGGEVKADANGDLTITKAGQYTALENGEIAVAAEGKAELRTGDNAVLFAGDSGNKVTGTYKGSGTAAKVEATLTSTNAAASLTATKAGAKLTVHGTEYIATADNTTVCYGTNTAELTAGTVLLDQGEVIAAGSASYKAAAGGATIDATSGFVGGAVTLDTGETVTVGGTTYTAAVNATVVDHNNGNAKLTAGAVALDGNEAILVGETTYTAGSNGATIDYNSGKAKLTAGAVLLDHGEAVEVGDATYTATESGATLDYNSGKANLTAGEVSFTSGKTLKVGETTYTAGSNGATLDYNSGNAKLITGTVLLDQGEVIAAGSASYKAAAGGATIDATSGFVGGAVTLDTGETVTVGGTTYTAAANATVIDYNNSNAKLTAGAVALDGNEAILVGETTYTAGSNGATIDHNSGKAKLTAGAVALDVNEAILVGETTYTAGSNGATIDHNSGKAKLTAGAVALDVNEAILVGETTYTAGSNGATIDYNSGKAKLTAGAVALDVNEAILVGETTYTAGSKGATIDYNSGKAKLTAGAVALDGNEAILVGETTYTAGSNGATIDHNSGKAKLTAGTVLLDQGEAIAAGSASYKAAAGGATIDATKGFVGGAVTLDTDETVTVGGTTYTAVANATVVDHNNGNAKLTAGAVALDGNEAILVGETTYTAGSNGATIDHNSGKANLTAGSVSFNSGKTLKVGETTYTAGSNGATLDYNSGKAKLTAGAVILNRGEAVEVGDATYIATESGATLDYNSGNANLTAGEVSFTSGKTLKVGETTYTAGTDGATLDYNSGKAKLTAGTVLLGQGEVIAAGSASYKAAAGGATIDATNGFVGGAVTLDTDETVTVGETTYTAAANATVVDHNNGKAKLTAGAVLLDRGEAVEVGDATYTATESGATLDYNSGKANLTAGEVSFTSGKTLKVGETTYTAGSNGATLDYNSGKAKLTAGTVLLGQGEVIAAGSASYKAAAGGATIDATNGFVGGAVTLDTGETVTVGETTYTAAANATVIDYNNSNAKLTAGAVALDGNEAILVGETTYTAGSNGATIDHNSGKANLTAGSVSFNSGKTLKVGETTYTAGSNGATLDYNSGKAKLTAGAVILNRGEAVEVGDATYIATESGATLDYNSGNANLTAGEVSFNLGKTLKVGETTYTAGSNGATLDYNSGKAKLTAGAVILDRGEAVEVGDATYTATESGATLDYNSGNANMTAGEVSFTSGKTLKVGETTYTAGSNGATLDYNSGKAKLTAGEVILDRGEAVEVGDATYTATESGATLDYNSGNANLTAGEVSFNLGKTLKVGETTYTAGSNGATLDYNSGNAKLITGTVLLDQGEAIAAGNATYKAAVGGATIDATSGFVGGAVTLDTGETVTVGGTTYTAAANATVVDHNNGKAKLTAGAVILDRNEAIEVSGLGTLTNNGSIPISVGEEGSILAADGSALPAGASFTTGDNTCTVTYKLSSDAAKITVIQTQDGATTKRIYKRDGDTPISVTMQPAAGGFDPADESESPASGAELSGVKGFTSSEIDPVKDIQEKEYYDGEGRRVEADRAVITIDGSATPKKVTVTGEVEPDISIDLTEAEATITDTTGTAVFTLNESSFSGKAFSVQDNIVTETGNLLKVLEGSVTTSDSNGNFSTAAGSSVTTTGNGTLTLNGAKVTLTGSGNGVTYTADDTSPNKISTITGLESGEAVTFESTFTGSEVTVDGTEFTAITSRNGITFRNQDGAVEVSLDQKGETVTVDGFTFAVASTSHSGLTVYKDAQGSQVAGLRNGDKVTVTKGDLTTTYTAEDGKLVIGYTDGDAKATTKSYTLGSEKSFTATWDGSAANAPVSTGDAGVSLEPGSATVGGTDLNSVVDGTQLDSHGNVTTDAGKAVATIETTDSSLTYRAKSDSGRHELDIADTNGVDWNIDTSEARGRTQVGTGTSETPVNNAVNVTAGSGSSEVAVYSNADSRITGGDGNLTATVGGSGDHHVTAGSGSKNELKDFGTGENVLTGGSGKNTFESSNENGKLVAGTGKNTFKTTAGFTNKVEGFTYGKDEVAIGAAVTDYSDFHVGEGTINYGGKDSGGEVDVSSGTGTGSAYAVTILDSKGKKTNVGWTGEDGGTLDASSETKPLVLIGSQNGDAKDLLMGGAGRDVIFAGEGDSVTGGAGQNELHLSGSSIAVGFGTAGARDEVTGFKAGFDESEADSILLMDTAVAENLTLSYDGKEAVLKSGGSRMTLGSIAKNNNTNAAELLIGEAKVAAIEKGQTANIKEADYADVYYGTGSAGLNFKEVGDDLIVDLSDTFKFRNIASVTGGAGNTILMGGSGKTTLVSGGGDTSLWGGTGNALLVGAKDARDEFFFFGESGRDTIAGFAAGTEDNSDVLNLFGSAITDIRGTNNGVEISTTENSRVLLQGLKPNDKIQWVSGEAKGVAKIGSGSQANTFTYDEEVTNYFGGDKTDTLKVSGEDHSVWLENLGSSIEIIDASGSTGDNILAGGREAETIKGGKGSTSLWGGAGGNDVLEGGSGYNELYFGKGEGTDLITKSNDGDKVMLYNVKLEDLNPQATGLKDGSMVIALKDGSTLTLQNYDSHGATTFQLADGTFSYDRKTGSWQEMK